jgi:hypothetical protein
MTKCIINAKFYGPDASGNIPTHFGYKCELMDGRLVADIPEELVEGEIAAGRAVLVETGYEPDQFTDMDREDLLAYLTSKGVIFPKNIPGARLLQLCRETAEKK